MDRSKRTNSLLSSAVILTALTFLSKLLTFVREQIIAMTYGATIEMDCYNIANGLLSNIIYLLFAALGVAYLPLYIENREKRGKEAASEFTNKVVTIFTIIAAILGLILFVFADLISYICAPKYLPADRERVSQYFRILSAGLLFTSATHVLTGTLNAEKKYGYSSLSGMILSATQILFMFLLAPIWGINSLVISVPVAYFVQMIVLLLRSNKFVKPKLIFKIDDDIKKLFKLAIPIFMSQSIVEINQLIDRLLSSTLTAGSVSALSYGANVSRVVNSLFSSVFSTLIFTELSESFVKKDDNRINRILSRSISLILFILVPLTIITIICGTDIVTIVYKRGAFGDEAVRLTTIVLRAYCITWSSSAISSLISHLFYSVHKTKIAMKVSIIAAICNSCISFALMYFIGFTGVVAGTVISSIILVILNFYILRKTVPNMKLKGMTSKVFKIVFSSLITGVVCFGMHRLSSRYLTSTLLVFILVTIVSFATYVLVSIIIKSEDLQYAKTILQNSIGRMKFRTVKK